MKSAYTYYVENGIRDTLMKSPYLYYVEDCEVVNSDHEIISHFTGFVYVFVDHMCVFRGTFTACNHFSFPDYFTSALLAVPRFDDDSPPSYFIFN